MLSLASACAIFKQVQLCMLVGWLARSAPAIAARDSKRSRIRFASISGLLDGRVDGGLTRFFLVGWFVRRAATLLHNTSSVMKLCLQHDFSSLFSFSPSVKS